MQDRSAVPGPLRYSCALSLALHCQLAHRVSEILPDARPDAILAMCRVTEYFFGTEDDAVALRHMVYINMRPIARVVRTTLLTELCNTACLS
jgi:hypothetical protein